MDRRSLEVPKAEQQRRGLSTRRLLVLHNPFKRGRPEDQEKVVAAMDAEEVRTT